MRGRMSAMRGRMSAMRRAENSVSFTEPNGAPYSADQPIGGFVKPLSRAVAKPTTKARIL